MKAMSPAEIEANDTRQPTPEMFEAINWCITKFRRPDRKRIHINFGDILCRFTAIHDAKSPPIPAKHWWQWDTPTHNHKMTKEDLFACFREYKKAGWKAWLEVVVQDYEASWNVFFEPVD